MYMQDSRFQIFVVHYYRHRNVFIFVIFFIIFSRFAKYFTKATFPTVIHMMKPKHLRLVYLCVVLTRLVFYLCLSGKKHRLKKHQICFLCVFNKYLLKLTYCFYNIEINKQSIFMFTLRHKFMAF